MATARPAPSPAVQLETFIDKYTSEMAANTRATLAWMRKRIPGAIQLVYDNFNWLVIGFGPSERPSEAMLSLAIAPAWVTLCFLEGVHLDDPKKLLRGAGNQVRNVRLMDGVKTLKDPAVQALIDQAVENSDVPYPRKKTNQIVIRAIAAKQRSRRPAAKSAKSTNSMTRKR